MSGLGIWINGIINRFSNYVFEFNDAKHIDIIFKTTAYIKGNTFQQTSKRLQVYLHSNRPRPETVCRIYPACNPLLYLRFQQELI